MTIEVFVFDEQTGHDVDETRWSALASATLLEMAPQGDVELSVSFVDEARITGLNEAFLGHVGPTDVLSFPIEDPSLPTEVSPETASASIDAEPVPVLLGDVVICPAIALRNAVEHGVSYEDELALLLVHGILHLLGMDHEDDGEAEEMEHREQLLLDRYFRSGEQR